MSVAHHCTAALGGQRGKSHQTVHFAFFEFRRSSRDVEPREEASHRFAAEEGCTATWSRIWSIEPIPFHPQLLALADEAVTEVTGIPALRLPSGPLHDAAEVARAGIPTAMLFVQSLRGLSHNALEDTHPEHLTQAVQALHLLATKTLGYCLPTETHPR